MWLCIWLFGCCFSKKNEGTLGQVGLKGQPCQATYVVVPPPSFAHIVLRNDTSVSRIHWTLAKVARNDTEVSTGARVLPRVWVDFKGLSRVHDLDALAHRTSNERVTLYWLCQAFSAR